MHLGKRSHSQSQTRDLKKCSLEASKAESNACKLNATCLIYVKIYDIISESALNT